MSTTTTENMLLT